MGVYLDRELPGTGGEVLRGMHGAWPLSVPPAPGRDSPRAGLEKVGNRGGLEHRHWPRGN